MLKALHTAMKLRNLQLYCRRAWLVQSFYGIFRFMEYFRRLGMNAYGVYTGRENTDVLDHNELHVNSIMR